MAAPSRTIKGKVAEHLFLRQPLVWVEGPTDVPVFRRFLAKLGCVLKEAGGKAECQKLADEIASNGYPYVVIIDGDYDCLTARQSIHRYVVILHRHSSENYLIEKDAIDSVARDFAKEDNDWIRKEYDSWINRFEAVLQELVELDVALAVAGKSRRIVPKTVDQILAGDPIDMKLDKSALLDRCMDAKSRLSKEQKKAGQKLVAAYLKDRRLVDLLRGHCAFGMVRYFLIGQVRARGCSYKCSDDVLRAMLASAIWGENMSEDHRSLERRLRRAAREVRDVLKSQRSGSR
jgi:hypothetical protein